MKHLSIGYINVVFDLFKHGWTIEIDIREELHFHFRYTQVQLCINVLRAVCTNS